MQDSSMRIKDPSVKTEEDIEKYYKKVFNSMYYNMSYEWIPAKLYHNKKDIESGVEKLVCWNHKFVFKKVNELEIKLITYMYKTDMDKMEQYLLNLVRRHQWNDCK